MNINMISGTVTINGVSYAGRNVTIKGDQVIVDGKAQAGALQPGPVTVNVVGDVHSLETVSGDVSVDGGVGSVRTTSGDVECFDVAGDVTTVSGDVECGPVSGSVRTVSGDVKHRGAA